MLENVLRTRIAEYAPANALEQENVLQELLQYYVLASLARADLFRRAVFHGGTCLRIVHGTNRFSEDLDFFLKERDPAFRWQPFIERVEQDCRMEGVRFEIQDRSEVDVAVRKAFLKTDSIGKILDLSLPFERRQGKKIRIKLEIDTNPPAGSQYRTSYITFPTPAALTTQTLPSGFSMKAHALLCRSYCKGRDWYDLIWYVTRRVVPDFPLLANALLQQGPWASQPIEVNPTWLVAQLRRTIAGVDWKSAQNDVRRFLFLSEQGTLATWGEDFFYSLVERMEAYLPK